MPSFLRASFFFFKDKSLIHLISLRRNDFAFILVCVSSEQKFLLLSSTKDSMNSDKLDFTYRAGGRRGHFPTLDIFVITFV